MNIKALTIKQPWASLIIRGGKDIENRDWNSNYRGIVAIHSSAKMSESDMEDACGLMRGFIPRFSARMFRQDKYGFPTGVILGVVEMIGCVRDCDSPWFVGDFGFQFRNAVAFSNPIPCKGSLGFWKLSDDLLVRCREEYRKSSEVAQLELAEIT
jgi:ASCH domain